MKKLITYNTVLTFGKHKGKSINDLIEDYPSYINWMIENFDKDKYKFDEDLLEEFKNYEEEIYPDYEQ